MWARLQLWDWSHSCWHAYRTERLSWKGGGATANVSECSDASLLYLSHHDVCQALKKLHGSCVNHHTRGRMIFIAVGEGPNKLLLRGFETASYLLFLQPTDAEKHSTSVDAANVVQHYNYHRSANQCVYHRKTQQQWKSWCLLYNWRCR